VKLVVQFQKKRSSYNLQMKKILYLCQFLMILQILTPSSVFGQASVYSSKRGGVTISIDDTPASDADVSTWESYRLLFNKYNYKFNIALQSEGLIRPVVASEVKLMMNDGHEMLDHCPQDNVSQFRFITHLEDSSLYVKKGVLQPGVASIIIGTDYVTVTLKTGTTLDPSAIPILAERTRLLYRRYLKDSLNYPKILAQPGDGTSVSQIDGYVFLKPAGYISATYDGIGKDNVITKTYSILDKLYHPAYNIKRADWGDLGNFQTTTKEIADRMAKHQVVSILFHYPSIPGLLTVTDQFLKWCRDNDVPLLTLSQWVTNLYGSYPDPTTNVFPDITKDINADSRPDGYEVFDANVILNKNDVGAPGGVSLSKNAWGNLFMISQLGGIEKGKNTVSFSAKGQVNASIRILALVNGTGQTYCDTTINLTSAGWKSYNAIMNVPDNANFSDISLALTNLNTGNSVSISNWQLSRLVKLPVVNILHDATITIKQTLTLSAEPGCTNYRWSTGQTIQSIVIDGSKTGPGIFPISYTADGTGGSLVADKAVITVNGLLYSPKSFTFSAINSNATVKITTNIPWTITSKYNFAFVNPSSGITSTDVLLSMPANPTVDPVDDTLTISAGPDNFLITVHQNGIPPVLTINRTSLNNIPRSGKIEPIILISNSKWKISHIPGWIIGSPLSGKGNANLSFTITNNSSITERIDSIVIKAPNAYTDSLRVLISVNQLGEDQYLNLDKNNFTVKAIANTQTINVTSNTKWTVSEMPGWIAPRTISGTGNGSLLFDIPVNPLRTPRIGTFKLSTSTDTTRIVTVTQAGVDYADIDRKIISDAANAKTETINIASSTSWNLSNKSIWLTVTPTSGTNNSQITLVLQENLKVDPRTDTVTVKAINCLDQFIIVTQAGAAPQLSIDKTTVTVVAAANSITLNITSNTTWAITDVPTWITPSQLTGNGNKSIILTIDQNKLKVERTPALLKISLANGTMVTFEVKQDASPSYITLTPESVNVGPNVADSTSIMVSSNVKWKVVNSVGWIKTNPDSWLSNDGDKKVTIKPYTQWLTLEDITGVDMQGSFTLEEDSSLPTKVVKTIGVTFKAIPAVLTVPVHTVTFNAIESKTYTITSNLPWSVEKKTSANWFNVTPTFSLAGTINLKIDCITTNASSRDNSVYLILKQTKGVIKDSILVVQAGSSVGVEDYANSGVRIYPQPAGETLNIDLPANNELKYWDIYNPAGIELLKGTIKNKTKLQIPVARLSPGLYFITLRSDTQKIGLKFTK